MDVGGRYANSDILWRHQEYHSYVLSRASSVILLRPFIAEQITFFIPLFYNVLSYFNTSKFEMNFRPITQHKHHAVKA